MPFAEIAGGNIHYQFDGAADAPVLVLSHSLGTSLSMWDRQAAALSHSFRILRYDARGHGRSLVTPGPYTIEQLARDVISFLDQLGIPRAHFCGLSMGGMVGMWLGAHEPSRFDRFVLANTAALMGPRDAWNKRIASVQSDGMAAVADAVIERWLTPTFRERCPNTTTAVRQMLLAGPTEGYCACCAAIRDMDQRASLASIHADTLVIAGTYDPATPPALTKAVADAITGARMIELPTAHLSNIEAPDAFNDAVADFLLG